MALIDDLVSYWKLDEASGNRADAHGSNTLTDNNTVGSGTGIINLGADFDSASSESLSISNAAQTGLNLGTGAFSISAWFKQESAGGSYRWVTKQGSSLGYGYALSFFAGIFRFSANSPAGAQDVDTANSFNNTNWQHVVATRGASNGIVIYVNASNVKQVANDARDVSTTEVFYIGRRDDGVYMNGLIDEVGIWSRELTSSEVTELYNGGAGLAYPFAGDAVVVPGSNLSLLGVG